MKIYLTKKIIKRDKIQENPDVLYLFGDNDIRKGLGGQAKEMRNEPNTIGISTKKFPSNKEGSFKTDDEYDENCKIIREDCQKIIEAIVSKKYKALVIPVIGVGMAKLPEKAPKTFKYLNDSLSVIIKFIKTFY